MTVLSELCTWVDKNLCLCLQTPKSDKKNAQKLYKTMPDTQKEQNKIAGKRHK